MKTYNQTRASLLQQCIFIILSAHWSSLASFHHCGWVWDLCRYAVSDNSLVLACLCSLSLHSAGRRHHRARVSQTQDFLAVEAKWNVVCLGLQPSLPLGLWPRWTVIKQGYAESALHISTCLGIRIIFVYVALQRVFSQWRSQPYVCFPISLLWCVEVLFQSRGFLKQWGLPRGKDHWKWWHDLRYRN